MMCRLNDSEDDDVGETSTLSILFFVVIRQTKRKLSVFQEEFDEKSTRGSFSQDYKRKGFIADFLNTINNLQKSTNNCWAAVLKSLVSFNKIMVSEVRFLVRI
jgi:hypothetical protein